MAIPSPSGAGRMQPSVATHLLAMANSSSGERASSNTTGVVDCNFIVGGTHLNLIDMGGQTLSATSLNTPSSTVTKGLFYDPIGGGSSTETGSTL